MIISLCIQNSLTSPDEDIMALFEEEVEDEDKDKWVVWFDGVSNALGHGIGAVLVSSDK